MNWRTLVYGRRQAWFWFAVDFVLGAGAVVFAYWFKDLPVEFGLLKDVPRHPGAIPTGLIFGGVLGVSYYALCGDGSEWNRFSPQRNLIVAMSCVAVATIAIVLIYYIFLLQLGRVIIVIFFSVSLFVTFVARYYTYSKIPEERRKLLLLTDDEHKPSPQMEDLLATYFDVEWMDRDVLNERTAEEWIEDWGRAGILDIVFVVRCDRRIAEELLVECWKHGLRFVEWNYFVEATFRKLNVYDEHLDWMMQFGHQYAHPAYSKLKRGIDILFAILGIILSLPLLLLGMIMVLVETGRPVFFQQERVGARGSRFTLWKLRTMRVDQDKSASKWSRSGDPRVTRTGRILRKTRIDELPQLFHVFTGEMSLVGPRPEWTAVAEEWEEKIPFYVYRTMVKPGLTGWAQVNFSYAETRDEVLEKLSYDFFYIKHASVGLDIRIMLRTIVAMFKGGR